MKPKRESWESRWTGLTLESNERLRQIKILTRERETAFSALSEASLLFAANDMEGVRKLLCDVNAQAHAQGLADPLRERIERQKKVIAGQKLDAERLTTHLRKQTCTLTRRADEIRRLKACDRQHLPAVVPARNAELLVSTARRAAEAIENREFGGTGGWKYARALRIALAPVGIDGTDALARVEKLLAPRESHEG
jgi:hypothetical protein